MDVGLVCDACSAFSPMGAFECVRCGLPVSLDPPRAGADEPDDAPDDAHDAHDHRGVADVEAVACPTCGVMVTYGHRFCFNCGGKMPSLSAVSAAQPGPNEFHEDTKVSRNIAKPGQRPTLFFSSMQQARAKLTLIRGDGLDGVSF